MKTLFTSWLLVMSSLACLGANEAETSHNEVGPDSRPIRYVIGLSPFLEDHDKDPLFRQLVGFLLEEVPLQTSIWFCDAFHLQTVARIDVPNLGAFRSAKTRANQFREQILKLKTFLATKHPQPQSPGLAFDQALRFPQFMDYVGDNLRDPEHAVIVMLFGSPLYLDEKEPGFSMAHGYYPSDGHLLAGRDASVFGLATRGDALQDIPVHFGWFGDPWVSEAHQQRIDRFWSLYLRGQGARLATFCGDVPMVFNNVRPGARAPVSRDEHHQLDPDQTRIEMLRMRREVGATDWITREALPDLPLGPPARTVGTMKIGIRWQGDIDLDLYARPSRHGETLFFEHVRSPEGYYFKDHRSSPAREYEFIEFELPVDVWKVESRINFYEGGSSGGAAGEIRIEFDGRIYSGSFQIEAEYGNQGSSGRDQQRFWSTIDIPAILNLRASTL